MGKRYRWNKRKCAENLIGVAIFIATGLMLGWVFALWAIA